MGNDKLLDAFMAQQMSDGRNMDSIVNGRPKEKKSSARKKDVAVSPEERKALDDIRNSRRGRKKPGEEGAAYKRVGFECREELLQAFDIIPYKVGKTRKELFEEALEYIIGKYS
jgi:hypothetical protein